MIPFLAILGGIAGALIGFIATAAIAYGLSGSGGSPDAAAGKMMIAAFFIAPVGGLAGLLLGTWCTLYLRGAPSILSAVAYSGLVLAIGAAVTYLVLDQADDIVRPNQATLELEFEIRLPPGTAAPEPLKAVAVELRTDRNTMPGALIARMTRKDGERAVLGGRVEVYFRTANRLLAVSIPGPATPVFRLKLAARPPLSDSYSAWEPATYWEPAAAARNQNNPDVDIRYRMIDPIVAKRN
jgi:hypothetical protein